MEVPSSQNPIQIPIPKKGGAKELLSYKKVIMFAGLPTLLVDALLTETVSGRITLETAQNRAHELRAELRMIKAVDAFLAKKFKGRKYRPGKVSSRRRGRHRSSLNSKVNRHIFSFSHLVFL